MAVATDALPRFEAGSFFGTLTVRDRETDLVIVHEAPWDADMAAFVEAHLNDRPAGVVQFHWEARL